MAGFEIVVRPVIFPDIRPAPAQPVPPADDPEQGFATIHGNGGKQFTMSESWSSSASSSQRSEFKRREDEMRVYQKNDDGSVNKENFVDVRVANKIWSKGPPSATVKDTGTTEPGMAGTERVINYYKRAEEKDNVELRRKDIVTEKGRAEG